MTKQAVAKVKVQRMRIGQDQMLGGLRGQHHGQARVCDRQGFDIHRHVRWKSLWCRIDPSDRHAGQRDQNRHQSPPDMACAPDPKLTRRGCQRLDHPTLQQLGGRGRSLSARKGDQPFDGQRHGAVGHAAGDDWGRGGQSVGAIDLGQKRDRTATTLAQLWAKRLMIKPGSPRRQHLARPLHSLPFQRPAANGSRLPVGPNQHRRPHLARAAAVMGGHDHPRDAAMLRHSLCQGGQIKHHGLPQGDFCQQKSRRNLHTDFAAEFVSNSDAVSASETAVGLADMQKAPGVSRGLCVLALSLSGRVACPSLRAWAAARTCVRAAGRAGSIPACRRIRSSSCSR